MHNKRLTAIVAIVVAIWFAICGIWCWTVVQNRNKEVGEKPISMVQPETDCVYAVRAKIPAQSEKVLHDVYIVQDQQGALWAIMWPKEHAPKGPFNELRFVKGPTGATLARGRQRDNQKILVIPGKEVN